MNLSRWIFSAGCSLLWLAAPLRAQVLTPVYDVALPAGHSSVIGLGVVGSNLTLYTLETYYTSPLYAGGSMGFTKALINFADLDVRLVPQSLALPDPSDANETLLTGGFGAQNLLYTYRLSPPAQTNVSVAGSLGSLGSNKPLGLAMAGDGTVFLDTAVSGGAGGVFKFASSGTSTPQLNFGLAGPGLLTTPGAMALGPDGLLYVLDTGAGRVVSFNTDGVYQNAFSLANTAAPSALAIGMNGVLFTANDNGGGDIYNISTGAHLGTLADTGDVNLGPGKATLLVEGNYLYATGSGQNVHVYDVSAVPEPSTTGALMGIGALTVAMVRRRKRNGR